MAVLYASLVRPASEKWTETMVRSQIKGFFQPLGTCMRVISQHSRTRYNPRAHSRTSTIQPNALLKRLSYYTRTTAIEHVMSTDVAALAQKASTNRFHTRASLGIPRRDVVDIDRHHILVLVHKCCVRIHHADLDFILLF